MIGQTSDVKIQQSELQLVQILPEAGSSNCNRQGNSHVYAKTGHWTDQQKLRYLMFIDYHHQMLELKEKRRQSKVFKAMSAFIRTRKSNQCRSHHQKMENYFQSTQSIISYFKNKIPNYLNEFEASQEELSQLKFGLTPQNTRHYNKEESISNNEECQSEQRESYKRRAKGSRTSIKLADQDQNHELNDKALPKTDQSLHHSSTHQQNQSLQSRPSLSFSFINNQPLGYQMGLGLIPFWSQQNLPRMNNFFEYYKNSSCSEVELKEWSECEQLYFQWRAKYESLTQQRL